MYVCHLRQLFLFFRFYIFSCSKHEKRRIRPQEKKMCNMTKKKERKKRTMDSLTNF